MRPPIAILLTALFLVHSSQAAARFEGFANHGLVGAGRVPGDRFDGLGPGIDTLGSIFSGLAFDPESWSRRGDEVSGFTYSGTLYCLPDRGYSAGSADRWYEFTPRLHSFHIEISPYYRDVQTAQTQIQFSNLTTRLLHDNEARLFTGFNGNDSSVPDHPRSAPDSPGQGRRSLDAEGLALTRDGGFFLCDEYGPFIYRFNSQAVMQYALKPPPAWIPKSGSTYGSRRNDFSADNEPDSGRRANRGFEGIAVTPDERRLVAILQSPLIQDGGNDNSSRNTRILVFDIDPDSPSYRQPIAEHVYELTLNGNGSRSRATLASELVAINSDQFLVLERDQRGLGSGSTSPMIYKQVVLIDLRGASNILDSGYSLEAGAPGQLSLPLDGLPAGLEPVARQDFVNLLDWWHLWRFNLNLQADFPDHNTLPAKWEGMAVMPLHDPRAPDDYLLLVGCDNDFTAAQIYHHGVLVGTNPETIDHLLLAFRVTLPGYQTSFRPSLAIRRQNGAIELSWPEAYGNYTLQSATRLDSDEWENISAERNRVELPADGSARYFRLHLNE